jgi:hypothetical protein
MAELVFRQCNVAIPEVDVGTDVFAFHDEREQIARLQIKSGQAKRYKKGQGYAAQFAIPTLQLEHVGSPPLHYVLAIRLEGQWVDYLIISREEFNAYRDSERRFGTENRTTRELVLSIQFRPTQVLCGEVDLTNHRNAWDRLPPLHPLLGLNVGRQEQVLVQDLSTMKIYEPPEPL